MIFDIEGIEKAIGYVFKDKMLLRTCFTHSSYSNEHGGENNEKLEFFGDSIMEFIVTEYLVKTQLGDEGDLTKLRQEIVSKQPLLFSVKKLGLYNFVLLGRGQQKNHSLDEKMYSSIYEALVAGIYEDGGLVPCRKFIKNTIIADFLEKKKFEKQNKANQDHKSKFQEYIQKRKIGSISYETLSKTGPAHMPEFRVAVLLNGKKIAEGKGGSKKQAEAIAAQKALKLLIKQEGKNN